MQRTFKMVLILGLLTGCAGPTTPFGPVELFSAKSKQNDARWDATNVQIHFTPERQNLHKSSAFTVHIHDPQGVPENYRLTLTYNGIDSTNNLLKSGKKKFSQPDRRDLTITLPDLRLPAGREHHILLTYRRTPISRSITAKFDPPICQALDHKQKLQSVPEFDPPVGIIKAINKAANLRGINPYLLAGLIAQESGFNPDAVSTAKAIGLTQITRLGAAEIIKKYPHWPRFVEIEEMPLPLLKIAILSGKVNAKNEWRLDPLKSINGGALYLEFLRNYWERPEKIRLVREHVRTASAMSDVLLASYNSGPARVSAALERIGSNYLQAKELSEALKYVRKVNSYCDHFTHAEN